MLLGISMNNQDGLTSGIVHMFNHAVIKGGLFLVVACIILPYVPFMLGLNYTSSNFTPLKILNPFATLWAIGSSHSTYGFLVPTLCLIALLAVAANGPAIVKDIQQVQKAVPAVSDAVATEVDPLQPG